MAVKISMWQNTGRNDLPLVKVNNDDQKKDTRSNTDAVCSESEIFKSSTNSRVKTNKHFDSWLQSYYVQNWHILLKFLVKAHSDYIWVWPYSLSDGEVNVQNGDNKWRLNVRRLLKSTCICIFLAVLPYGLNELSTDCVFHNFLPDISKRNTLLKVFIAEGSCYLR